MRTSAILFDLDNTLYPSSSGLMQSVDVRITEYVQRTTGLGPEEALTLRRQYFMQYGATLRGLQNHYSVDIEDYLAYVHDVVLESFLASDAELDHLLSQTSATKAIFTNAPKEHAQRVLKALGIERHFEHIFDLRFFSFKPKPHPFNYQHALDILEADGPSSVLIEDTLQNLSPARALGMTTILIGDPSDKAAASLADHIVPDILAALRVILDL